MARRILQNITVETRGDGQPAEFVWRGRLYTVAGLIEHWKESGSWWDGEPERDVFRVVDASGRIFDCLLYTSPSPRDRTRSRMPSSA